MKPSGYRGGCGDVCTQNMDGLRRKTGGKVLPNKMLAGNNKIIVYISGPRMVYSK